MDLLGHMRIPDSGIHRSFDTPGTSHTPAMTSSVYIPSPSTPTHSSSTTISTTETDADVPGLSCPYCPRTFTSHTDLVGHLRIHRTETGEPVPRPPTYTKRMRLNCSHYPRTFSHMMGLLGYMRIHENLQLTIAGHTTPSHLPPPAPAPHILITHRPTTQAFS
ncbi:hypothetical protein SprV_0100295500 [Sparganum proliferum]